MFEALAVLREAIRNNPQLKLAFGVAALGAVVLIVLSFVGGDRELAILGGAFVIGFMLMLSVFAAISGPGGTTTRPILAASITWGISILFLATLALVFSSYFFCWPQAFGRGCIVKTARVQIQDLRFISEEGSKRKVEGSDAYWVVPQLKARASRGDFHLKRLDGAVFFIAAHVRGFEVLPGDKTKVEAQVQAFTDGDLVETNFTGDYGSPTEWERRKIPSEIKQSGGNVREQLRTIFDLQDKDMMIIVACGCFRDKEGQPTRRIKFLVTIFDKLSMTYHQATLEGSIIRDSN